jgi:hypothetical protein
MRTEAALASVSDLAAMVSSWRIHLEAANLSPKTIRTYLDAVRQFDDHLKAKGMPRAVDAIAPEHVESFLVAVRDRTSASTASTRYRAYSHSLSGSKMRANSPKTLWRGCDRRSSTSDPCRYIRRAPPDPVPILLGQELRGPTRHRPAAPVFEHRGTFRRDGEPPARGCRPRAA